MFGKIFTLKGFTKRDFFLWGGSIVLILASFFIFDRENFLSPISSVIGVTSLIFIAKGNPLGQALTVIFSVFYGIISFSFNYYGEMITYLGMTAPMACAAMVSWLKNPYKDSAQVSVNRLKLSELWIMIPLAAAVTVAFFFLLRALGTANLLPSTVSVTTSFLAVYLLFRRSPFYALAYAANDIVLIVLWAMAAMEDISYFSVLICFAVFLANDVYGFISWLKMDKWQNERISEKHDNYIKK